MPESATKTITFDVVVDPRWDAKATLVANLGLDDQQSLTLYFSKAQALAHIETGVRKNRLNNDQADYLRKQVAESSLPDDLAKVVFIECGKCKGHGWIVLADYQPVSVVDQNEARHMLDAICTKESIEEADRAKVLEQIAVSSLPEQTSVASILSRLGVVMGQSPSRSSKDR